MFPELENVIVPFLNTSLERDLSGHLCGPNSENLGIDVRDLGLSLLLWNSGPTSRYEWRYVTNSTARNYRPGGPWRSSLCGYGALTAFPRYLVPLSSRSVDNA